MQRESAATGILQDGANRLWGSLCGKALVIGAYLALNLSLNILNKWVLSRSGFAFPILLGVAHMGFSFLALLPLMASKAACDQHKPTLLKQGLGLVMVGTLFAINIGFNNVSLITISLSLNQVIRATIPVVTAVSAVFVEDKLPTRQEFLALLALVAGVGVAVWDGSDSRKSAVGIVLCILGTICNGLMMSLSGRLMSEKIEPLRLTFYFSPVCCIVLLPFYFSTEAAKYGAFRKEVGSSAYIGLVLLTCVIALCYNLIHYFVIKVTSATTTTVVGEMKIVLILVLSAVILGESDVWTIRMLVGCTLAILGFVMYSHCKLSAKAPNVYPLIKGVPDLAPSLSGDRDKGPLLAPGDKKKSWRG